MVKSQSLDSKIEKSPPPLPNQLNTAQQSFPSPLNIQLRQQKASQSSFWPEN